MFEFLGQTIVRRRRMTLVVFVVGLVVAGVVGSGVFSRLGSAGFDDPGSDSAVAAQHMRDTFGQSDPAVVLAVETAEGVDRQAAAATSLVQRVAAEPGVERVVSYWTAGAPPALRSEDGRTGLVLVFPEAQDDAEAEKVAGRLVEAYGGTPDGAAGLTVFVGGEAVVGSAINERIGSDLARAEAIAVPLTVLLLVLVFGSLVAAGLPFLVAAGSVLGTFLVLFLVTLTTDVSIFALNLVTGLGLGLGIDYALLVVNRFREELARGADPHTAVVRTVASAGRTVFVSGLTVAVTLASLLLFPQYFLRSFGYAGIAVTAIAVLSAVVVLPAVLALLGTRVNRFKVVRGDLAPRDTGVWASLARRVMRSPWPVLLVVVAGLLVVASPAKDVTFGQVDDRTLPASDPAAVASQVLRDRFPGDEATPATVVLPGAGSSPQAVADYALALSRVEHVVRVVTPSSVVVDGAVAGPNPAPQGFTVGDDLRLAVVADVAPRSSQGQALVADLRDVPAPVPGTVVGGVAAEDADSQAGITGVLPLVLLWIALTTLVVLFLFTGSVVLPVKAILLNVLSLAATLGLLVWVFQQGNLSALVGEFTNTGTVDTSTVVLVAVVAFALSMDYEVFLLARIKEEHDAGLPNAEAVSLGLQRSGRIITAAAALLAIVFAAFVSSGVTNIKQLGLGIAFAILLDATVVRGLLVPAAMRLLGRANWWAPAPLRALHRRFGLSEGGPQPGEPQAPVRVPTPAA